MPSIKDNIPELIRIAEKIQKDGWENCGLYPPSTEDERHQLLMCMNTAEALFLLPQLSAEEMSKEGIDYKEIIAQTHGLHDEIAAEEVAQYAPISQIVMESMMKLAWREMVRHEHAPEVHDYDCFHLCIGALGLENEPQKLCEMIGTNEATFRRIDQTSALNAIIHEMEWAPHIQVALEQSQGQDSDSLRRIFEGVVAAQIVNSAIRLIGGQSNLSDKQIQQAMMLYLTEKPSGPKAGLN